jgi:hypothetical protein
LKIQLPAEKFHINLQEPFAVCISEKLLRSVIRRAVTEAHAAQPDGRDFKMAPSKFATDKEID